MDVSPTPLASATPEHRRHRKKKVKRSSRIKRKAPLVIALLLAWVALLGVWYYLVTIWHPAAQATLKSALEYSTYPFPPHPM